MPIETTCRLTCDWPGCNTHQTAAGHGYGVPVVPIGWRMTFDKALCPMHAEQGFAELYEARLAAASASTNGDQDAESG